MPIDHLNAKPIILHYLEGVCECECVCMCVCVYVSVLVSECLKTNEINRNVFIYTWDHVIKRGCDYYEFLFSS